MAFIWKQLIQYLYPSDIYSLRIANHFVYSQIKLNQVYDEANKCVLKNLKNDPEHYGTDYHGYLILSPSFLLGCLTGQKFDGNELWERINDKDFFHWEFNCNMLLHEIPLPTFDFLKNRFYGGKVYVANWNSIIEKKCYVQYISNPKNYFCSNLYLKELRIKKEKFKNYQIKIAHDFPLCSINKPQYCCDLEQHFTRLGIDEEFDFIPSSQIWNFELEYDDDDQGEDYGNNYLFKRLEKKQNLKKKREKLNKIKLK